MRQLFRVCKGDVIELGEGHTATAKRCGMAYFENNELKMMQDTPPPSQAEPNPAPAPQAIQMWHDRIKDVHPHSDPEYWPSSLKAMYMESEILELRRALASPPPQPASAIAPNNWQITVIQAADKSWWLCVKSPNNRTIMHKCSASEIPSVMSLAAALATPEQPQPAESVEPETLTDAVQVLADVREIWLEWDDNHIQGHAAKGKLDRIFRAATSQAKEPK